MTRAGGGGGGGEVGATRFVSSKNSHLLKVIVTLVHLQECDVPFSLFSFYFIFYGAR